MNAHVDPRLAVLQDAAYPSERGVTIRWLAKAFDMKEDAVRYKLRNCPAKSIRARGTTQAVPYYDLKTAAPFLVTPIVTTKDVLKAMKRGDLPPQLQDLVWSAMLKRQQWEEKAGDLWRTEDVRRVFSEVFQTIKSQMQLWDTTLERNMEITEAQRLAVVQMKDALANDIYTALVEQMKANSTPPQVTQVAHQFGETESLAEAMDDDDLEDVV